jgi:hypothetical protein
MMMHHERQEKAAQVEVLNYQYNADIAALEGKKARSTGKNKHLRPKVYGDACEQGRCQK